MQLEILTLEMWWANACRRIIRKTCPGRRDNGCKGTAWCQWSNCFVGEWHTACRSSVGQAVLQQHSHVRSYRKELSGGTFRKYILYGLTLHTATRHWQPDLRYWKKQMVYLCFCSVWSLTSLQVIPAQPAWSRQQCLRTLCVLCGCAVVGFLFFFFPQEKKSTSFLLNWET